MCDYLACPSNLSMIIFSVVFLIVIALIIYWRTKKLLFSFFIFSALGNIVFYLDASSPIYYTQNLRWIVKFTLDYWPWINIVLFVWLIINFIKNKNAKTK
jgi:hypothetical protein